MVAGKDYIEPTWELVYLESLEELEKLAPALAQEDVLPIDTETAGWQNGQDYLCLLQIGLPSKKQIYLVDFLAIETLEPIKEILENEEAIKIAHYAPFEKRILSKAKIRLAGQVDTIDLAKLLRPDLPSFKLSTCVKAILGLDLGKELQGSDWSERPLSKEQLDYAALDVEITYALYSELVELEDGLEIAENETASKLMKQLYEVSKEKYQLLEPIAKRYFFLEALEEEIRDRLHEIVAEEGEDFSNDFGKANYRKTKRSIIDPELLRKELPGLAEEIIEERVLKTKFKELMKEHNIDKSVLERIEKLSGEYDSVSIKLKDWLTE